jgi:hypothetical protein
MRECIARCCQPIVYMRCMRRDDIRRLQGISVGWWQPCWRGSSYLPVLEEPRWICPQSRLMCLCERRALACAREPMEPELAPCGWRWPHRRPTVMGSIGKLVFDGFAYLGSGEAACNPEGCLCNPEAGEVARGLTFCRQPLRIKSVYGLDWRSLHYWLARRASYSDAYTSRAEELATLG